MYENSFVVSLSYTDCIERKFMTVGNEDDSTFFWLTRDWLILLGASLFSRWLYQRNYTKKYTKKGEAFPHSHLCYLIHWLVTSIPDFRWFTSIFLCYSLALSIESTLKVYFTITLIFLANVSQRLLNFVNFSPTLPQTIEVLINLDIFQRYIKC